MLRSRWTAVLAGSLLFGQALPACAPARARDQIAGGGGGAEAAARARIRDLGFRPGVLPPGPLNAITDVAGVAVGHVTLLRGESVRTGVTAIVPHGGDPFREKVRAGVHVGNGFGKAAGFLQVQELGVIETPIILTNTLSVGRAIEGAVRWTLARPGNEQVRSVNAVVGETNDGHLNDIRGMHVTVEDVLDAIDGARGGPVAEGAVGAGTGTVAFGFKGGIGTASRRVAGAGDGFTVGALVQTNFGGVLAVDGVPVGERLGRLPPGVPAAAAAGAGDGSCMIVIATDAPLSARSLERLAARGMLGLARTGSFMAHGSGDFAVAFSTANRVPHGGAVPVAWTELADERLNPLFLAAVEAVEEAVLNSLAMAVTVAGRDGHVAEAIDLDLLRRLAPARAQDR